MAPGLLIGLKDEEQQDIKGLWDSCADGISVWTGGKEAPVSGLVASICVSAAADASGMIAELAESQRGAGEGTRHGGLACHFDLELHWLDTEDGKIAPAGDSQGFDEGDFGGSRGWCSASREARSSS